ncbi:MAG TPA: TonB-dependent receptor, partial [Desulfomicrobiaceae bacterium]|nr:TonB-dependent receptor [Desulfomicrobiaceae bacterium]
HARKLRFPSLKEMYSEDKGDPELDPEFTTHYELGIEQEIPAVDTTFSVTGFRIDAKDFIEKIEDDYQNNDKYRFQGVEVAATNTSIRNLKLHAAYTYLNAENKSDTQEMEELQYRPENKLAVDATYSFPFGFTAYASYLFIAGQYELGDLEGKDGVYDTKERIDDIHVVNLKLSQALFEDALEVYVGADNLFDADYEESYALPREGRTLYTGLTYRF